MTPEFINMYIGKILAEVQELTKTKLLLQTQLEYTESLNKTLAEELDKYRKQDEKVAKKAAKKEENTF